jgi:hypothetical protein
MGKILWHITMSLDGYIAGPGDDVNLPLTYSWMTL